MSDNLKTLAEREAEETQLRAAADAAKWERTMELGMLHYNQSIYEGRSGNDRIAIGYTWEKRLQQKWVHRETGEEHWREIPTV